MKNNSLINDFLARYITCLTLGRQNYYVADIANIKDKIKRSSGEYVNKVSINV